MFEQRVNSDVLTVSTVNSQDQVTQNLSVTRLNKH
ncbi:DNA-binding protein Fis [Lelliottia amnigena]|nr:DNA-binding protein Fis [Lelliottia amnigena]